MTETAERSRYDRERQIQVEVDKQRKNLLYFFSFNLHILDKRNTHFKILVKLEEVLEI